MKFEYLETYELTLRTLSPVFVGNNTRYQKYEYCFNPRTKMVQIINQDALFDLLLKKNNQDLYESFVMGTEQAGLYCFLTQQCGFTDQMIDGIARYQASAADAMIPGKPLREIWAFNRLPDGRAYIPGSSLKGVFRTVLLSEMMQQEKKVGWPYTNNKWKSAQSMAVLEGSYLNVLNLKKDKQGQIENNPLNSLLRGMAISDSAPVSDDKMILCRKEDIKPDGTRKALPLCRECIKPGTDIHFRLTLDQSVLKNSITKEKLLACVKAFNELYLHVYLPHFRLPQEALEPAAGNVLYLGGGVGYFQKTLTYSYLNDEKAVEEAQSIMLNQFRNGHHDVFHGIAPHTVKYTLYQGKLYPMGMCEVQIQ